MHRKPLHSVECSSRGKGVNRRGSRLSHDLRSNTGFTLVEIMIGLGLLAIVSLAIASIADVALKTTKGQEQKSAQLELASEAQSILSNPSVCGYNFGSSAPGGALNINSFPKTIPQIALQGPSGPEPMVVASTAASPIPYKNSAIRVTSIRAHTPTPLLDAAGAATNDIYFTLSIATAKIMTTVGPDVFRDIELKIKAQLASPYVAGGSNVVTSCMAVGSKSDLIWTQLPSGDIYYNAGSVGVATSSPRGTMQIGEPSGASADLYIQGATTIGEKGIRLHVNNSASNAAFERATMDVRAKNFAIRGVAPTVAGDASVERVFVDLDTGNVGVGTTAPKSKLEVNGAIKLGGPAACGADQEGSLAYDYGAHEMKYCGGSPLAWRSLSAPATPMSTASCASAFGAGWTWNGSACIPPAGSSTVNPVTGVGYGTCVVGHGTVVNLQVRYANGAVSNTEVPVCIGSGGGS